MEGSARVTLSEAGLTLEGAPTSGLPRDQERESCSQCHLQPLLQLGRKLHTAPRLPVLRPQLRLHLELPHQAAAAVKDKGVTRSRCYSPTSRTTSMFETSLGLPSTITNTEAQLFLSTHSELSENSGTNTICSSNQVCQPPLFATTVT